jgi:transglutaminase-like putative cysteine protease
MRLPPDLAPTSQPSYTLHGIPDGVEGVRVTLDFMVRLAREYRRRPAIRELALQLVASVPEKNYRMEADELFRFVRDSIRYVQDINGVETLQTPERTLIVRQGDCDDKSVLLAALLESLGHPARFAAIGFEPDQFSHVFVETKIGADWIGMDATEAHPMGWQPEGVLTRMVRHI